MHNLFGALIHIYRQIGKYVEQGTTSENIIFIVQTFPIKSLLTACISYFVFFNLDFENAVKVETEAMSDLQVASSKEFPTEFTQKISFQQQ